MTERTLPTIEIGPVPLTIEQVVEIAHGRAKVALSNDLEWRRKLSAGPDHLAALLREEGRVYGVTTGVGDSCETPISSAMAADFQLNLLRFHGVGTGRLLSETESAAVVAVRLASLSVGWSAVREVLLQRLCDLINHRVLPCIPAEGSVGASGDLTPLSYVAAVLVGEREVYFKGQVRPAIEVFYELGLPPLKLQPKEALALMNGTSVMTGLACLAFKQSERLARLSASLTAMGSDVTRGNQAHFDDRLFIAKPHPGQRACARWIREDIGYDPKAPRETPRVQDRYSIRCAPHVIGVLLDALPFMRRTIEIELNGANDNPLIDPETGDVLHGGNFYGGHIAFVMDSLKTAVANLADLMDRQMALICNPTTSNGLPANLVARKGPDAGTHHAFKAMQISTSALAAEALKLTMPASVFSRSTECHNQDKVSMGTIAARDCLRVLELTETVGAMLLLAMCQAVDIREGEGCHTRSQALHKAVRRAIPVNTADRRMEPDVQWALSAYRAGELPIGESDFT
jgi:histidine ammonia-lyase